MSYHTIIAKLGGNIIENRKNLKSTISQFKQICEYNLVQKIVIVPGGGSYANFVRMLDKKINIGDDLSHWMAIFAMNSNGITINQQYSELTCYSNLDQLKKSKKKIIIFLPYDYFYQLDDLPHSWDVTSDSITLYIAHQLGLKDCFLIKDIDGIISTNNKILREISTSEYKNLKEMNQIFTEQSNQEDIKLSRPIDSYLLNLINKYKINCIILNGSSNKKRIINYFNESEDDNTLLYTKIIA